MNEENITPAPAQQEQNNAPLPRRTSRQMALSVLEWIELFAVSFAVVLMVITFAVRHSPVVGQSMYDTLDNNDILLVSDLCYTPKRGDIIVVQSQKYGYKSPLVKRVVAVGGDWIEIDFETWTVKVNGETVDETGYVTRPEGVPMRQPVNGYNYPIQVPEGMLFVMGDNRNGSIDSRAKNEIGFVEEELIIGKVFFRIFPFDKFGSL